MRITDVLWVGSLEKFRIGFADGRYAYVTPDTFATAFMVAQQPHAGMYCDKHKEE